MSIVAAIEALVHQPLSCVDTGPESTDADNDSSTIGASCRTVSLPFLKSRRWAPHRQSASTRLFILKARKHLFSACAERCPGWWRNGDVVVTWYYGMKRSPRASQELAGHRSLRTNYAPDAPLSSGARQCHPAPWAYSFCRKRWRHCGDGDLRHCSQSGRICV